MTGLFGLRAVIAKYRFPIKEELVSQKLGQERKNKELIAHLSNLRSALGVFCT